MIEIDDNKYYSVKQVAEILNVSTRTIYNFIYQEKIISVKIVGSTRIQGTQIKKLIANK